MWSSERSASRRLEDTSPYDDDIEDMPESPKRYREVYADDFITQDLQAPLSTLPVQTAKLLLQIFSESPSTFYQSLEDPNLDLCHEISREEMREAVERLKGVSAAEEGKAILASFSEDTPNLTIFEVCSRVGRGDLLRDLQSAAQARLLSLILKGTATMQQVIRLLRAGADPTRQNLSCFVNLKGEAKRTKIEVGPDRSGSHRGALMSGTPLHWVCWAASRLQAASGPLSAARQQHYLEISRWLCDIAPMALFLKNDNQQTPLELLMANTPSRDELRCGRCGQTGHVEKECLREPAKPSKMLVAALARGLSKAMQQYPLLSAARLVDGGGLRAAIDRAKELLLEGEEAVDGPAVEALEVLLAQSQAEAVEATAPALPSTAQLSAAESLGGLAVARARQKAMAAIHQTKEEEMEQADNAALRRQLAALQETRQRERQELEASIEALEAQLSEAQRRAEEAEVQVVCLTPQPQQAQQEKQHLPASSSEMAGGTETGDASSEAAFIAHLRQRRLIASGCQDLPEHVREGVQQLSDSLCAAVERLASDLYESECHFLYEIIQNAEDAHARDRPQESAEPRLSLRLGPPSVAFPHGYFISENNEAGFTERDVTALCDISASSKKKPLPGVAGGSIGCKGIGFKSVFTVSDRAHVLSKGFTFVFDVAGPLGKLGYVTPTWLSGQDVAALPAEVAQAHAAGRTVLFLPLRAPGLASAIGQEMDELSAQGRASLLFLRRLCCIELLRQVNHQPRLLRRTGQVFADESQQARSVSVVMEQLGDASKHEHRYVVYRHKATVESSAAGTATAELVLAFPVMGEDESGRCEPLFCSLPIRQVGFGFALHCDCFDLVANRSDLHRGSVANRAVRDALPEAFAGACQSSSEISQHALQLLGEPVADPFWRVAREGILERLSEVSCVQTSMGDLRKPGEVLLRGSGSLRRASELMPAELVRASCGRSLCDTSDSSEERLLRKLGAEDFAAKHLGQCLAFRGGAWPQGWVASIWDGGSAEGLRRVAALYNLLGAIVRPGEEEGNEAVDLLLQLPSLPLFPLLRDKNERSEFVCAKLEEGPIYLGLCPALSERWQLVLGTHSALRLLPPSMKTSLDSLGTQLLTSLGIEPPSRVQLAEAALQRQLEVVPCVPAPQPVAYCCWAALAVLRDLWAEPLGDGAEIRGIMAVCHALKNLGTCKSVEAAEALVKLKGEEGGIGAILLAPADEMRPPPSLRCPSLLGHSRELPADLVERIEGFLGTSSVAVGPPQKLQTWPLADCQDAHQRRLEALLWEAFFVDCLGAQPRRPADWRQERVPADLAFSLGQELGSDGARSLWVSLLDEKAVPDAVFRYATRRLSHAADRAWLSELPARAKLRVRELFLHSVYWPVAGAALNGLYLDLPQLGAAEGRGFQLQQCLRGLGARAHLDIEGLAAALEALLRGLCRSPAHFARIYSNIDTLETTAEPGHAKHAVEVEHFLQQSIFDPALPDPVKANDCVWELPKNELLAQCCSLTVLRDIYTTFGDVQLKRYFEARGVPAMPNTAESYLRMCQNLMDAAEELGKAWRRAEGNPEMALVTLPGSPKPNGASRIGAVDFLNQVWDALLFIYKGMSSLEGQQRDALRPFSPVHTLLVPLPCPQGGPPQVSSMLEVARFYDGALFRRISVCESFWEVAPDLADSPAAAWAMSLAFPPELKPLFVECFGVREVVDTAGLREGILARVNHGKRGGISRPGGFGFGSFGSELGSKAVNELGLPDELLRALGDGRGSGTSEGDALAAAEEALASLRRRPGGGGHSSGDEDNLVAPALPARSVRCPAAPERRLRRAGHARGRRGERVAVYRVQRLEMRGLELARGYDASEKELDDLAVVLQGLVSVFQLDCDCVAIVNGDVVTTQDDKGDCHHGARRHWPLLFSAGLRPAAESSFWFGEFCHALAHRSTGPGHGAHHSRVMQILMAQHFDAFAQHFSQAQLGQQVPTRARRRRSSSSRRSRRRRRKR